ncbi:MAG: biotin--[acetyl-CoA-carboxylase] ligase [Nocardioidaceae bacterium]
MQRILERVSSMYGDLSRPPLRAHELRRALVSPTSRWRDVEVLDEVESTNTVLAQQAAGGAPSGAVLVAEHQASGRGRLDRGWSAPVRSAITMSVLVRPHGMPLSSWPWVPLLAGLAVAASVRHETTVPASLKWPNDVVVDDRKLAGVLVERVDGGAPGAAAVIGLGVNVSLSADELPTQNATSLLLEEATTTDRSVLVRAILRALDGLLSTWECSGTEPRNGLLPAYVDACSTLGRQVRVELPDGGSSTGEAVGVDETGRLLVRSTEGQQAFAAGDVVHLWPKT